MKAAQRIAVFTDRYPLLGPLIWILSVQYFAAQLAVAQRWPVAYSWTRNMISDLGNTTCGNFDGRYVCSPGHALMNASFIMLGLTMALGSLLIYTEFRRSRGSLIGFSLMALAGFGTLLVGIFPENTILGVHYFGAFLAFGLGNLSIVILSLVLRRETDALRVFSFLTGVLALVALGLFVLHAYLGLGRGGMERVVSYPQAIWLTLFGMYMFHSHFRRSLK